MFYLTSKFHDDSVSTFGFMEGLGACEALPGPETPKKPRRNRVKLDEISMTMFLKYLRHKIDLDRCFTFNL